MGRLFRRDKKRDGPLSAASYGFCHAEALQEILAEDPRCAGEIEFTPLRECFLLTEEDLDHFEREVAPQLDVLIFQPVRAGTLGHRRSSDAIKKHVSPECVKLSFPIFRFDLDTPHFSYPVPEAPKPPFDYLDFSIVKQFLDGTPVAEALPGSRALEISDGVLDRIAHWAFVDLKNRELGEYGKIDVRLLELVRERMGQEVLFHTINHPAPAIMSAVVEQLVEKLHEAGEIADVAAGPGPQPDHFAKIHLPVHPSVQRYLGLEDPTPLTHGNKTISDAEAVGRTYEYLEQIGREMASASLERLRATHPWNREML
jgi:hypothetical protein